MGISCIWIKCCPYEEDQPCLKPRLESQSSQTSEIWPWLALAIRIFALVTICVFLIISRLYWHAQALFRCSRYIRFPFFGETCSLGRVHRGRFRIPVAYVSTAAIRKLIWLRSMWRQFLYSAQAANCPKMVVHDSHSLFPSYQLRIVLFGGLLKNRLVCNHL